MTRNLYVLEKVTPNEIIELEKKKADIVTFDYASHKQLVNHRIIHDLLDNYFEDREREMIFKFCSEYLLKLENFDNHKTAYHDVNLVNIVDRNELLESMMDIIPQAHVLKKILEKEEYDNVYVSSRLFEIFYKSDLAKNFIKYGIRVNSILPGNIMHENSIWNKKFKDDNEEKNFLNKTMPHNDWIYPIDIYETITFLIKNKNVVNTEIILDGGQSIFSPN